MYIRCDIVRVVSNHGFIKTVIYRYQYLKAEYKLWFADILILPHLDSDERSPRTLMLISDSCVDRSCIQPHKA